MMARHCGIGWDFSAMMARCDDGGRFGAWWDLGEWVPQCNDGWAMMAGRSAMMAGLCRSAMMVGRNDGGEDNGVP